jgi:hypothetical protein
MFGQDDGSAAADQRESCGTQITASNREIVSITADHPRHRYTFREAFARTEARTTLCSAWPAAGRPRRDAGLERLPALRDLLRLSCSAFVCHTINPRLFEDQIAYIVIMPRIAGCSSTRRSCR